LSEIAGNSELLAQGAGPVGSVKEGRAPLGLTIDFLAQQARANGLPIDFVYPERTAFLPGHVAILAKTQHFDLAKAFVDFTLSRAAQRLMMETDSSRHPARPDAYDGKPVANVDPFALPRGASFAYDAEIGRRRPGLVVALFDVALNERHANAAELWRAIHAAEAKKPLGAKDGAALKEARRLVGLVPVSAREAADPAFLERFAKREAVDPALTQKWRAELDAVQTRARELLSNIGAAP
jgi:spermidine/putrescine-binding protein